MFACVGRWLSARVIATAPASATMRLATAIPKFVSLFPCMFVLLTSKAGPVLWRLPRNKNSIRSKTQSGRRRLVLGGRAKVRRRGDLFRSVAERRDRRRAAKASRGRSPSHVAVSRRVNKTRTGDDDPTLLDEVAV